MSRKGASKKKIELTIALISLLVAIITLVTKWTDWFPPQYDIVYSGYVRDENSEEPIRDVDVSLRGVEVSSFGRSVTTNNAGKFDFGIIESSQNQFNVEVLVTHDDYKEWSSFRILTENTTPEEIRLVRGPPPDTGCFKISGYVLDTDGNRISGVEIVGNAGNTFTANDGSFSVKAKGKRGQRILLSAYKKGYEHQKEYVSIPNPDVQIHLEKK